MGGSKYDLRTAQFENGALEVEPLTHDQSVSDSASSLNYKLPLHVGQHSRRGITDTLSPHQTSISSKSGARWHVACPVPLLRRLNITRNPTFAVRWGGAYSKFVSWENGSEWRAETKKHNRLNNKGPVRRWLGYLELLLTIRPHGNFSSHTHKPHPKCFWLSGNLITTSNL